VQQNLYGFCKEDESEYKDFIKKNPLLASPQEKGKANKGSYGMTIERFNNRI